MTLNQNAWQYPYDMWQRVYLECKINGHYKFYEMINISNDMWKVRYGKIGTDGRIFKYDKSLWEKKLSEKLKKNYVVYEAVSIGTQSKPPGTAPPTIPQPKDPDVIVDTEFIARIDRIVAFLEEKGLTSDEELATSIGRKYRLSGVLSKDDMESLNRLWTANGGGRW
jgi:hypothetical protein